MLSMCFTMVLFAEVDGCAAAHNGTPTNLSREVGRLRNVVGCGGAGAAVVKCSVGGAAHAAPPSPFTGRPRRPAPRPPPPQTSTTTIQYLSHGSTIVTNSSNLLCCNFELNIRKFHQTTSNICFHCCQT